MGYLLLAATPDLGRGVTPLVAARDLRRSENKGYLLSAAPRDLGHGVTLLGCRPGFLPASARGLGRG